MRIPNFLRRLVRQVRQEDRILSLEAQVLDLTAHYDGMNTSLEMLSERVKELEEVEHLTEEDISLEIDTVLQSKAISR